MRFEEIYRDFWQRIFRLCMGYVNDIDLAKDLAQEAFIIVYSKLPEFRQESTIGTWIFRIASNLCLRQIDKQKRFPKTEVPPHLQVEPSTEIESQIARLYEYIAELVELDRIVIGLELEDVPQAEIAEIVGISSANVRVKVHRIKAKLKQKFEENE